MRYFLMFLLCLIPWGAFAADAPAPAQTPRISLFSTSTDWEGLTGLRYSEYRGNFIPSSGIVGRGLVL